MSNNRKPFHHSGASHPFQIIGVDARLSLGFYPEVSQEVFGPPSIRPDNCRPRGHLMRFEWMLIGLRPPTLSPEQPHEPGPGRGEDQIVSFFELTKDRASRLDFGEGPRLAPEENIINPTTCPFVVCDEANLGRYTFHITDVLVRIQVLSPEEGINGCVTEIHDVLLRCNVAGGMAERLDLI